jgi:hypothetical protein
VSLSAEVVHELVRSDARDETLEWASSSGGVRFARRLVGAGARASFDDTDVLVERASTFQDRVALRVRSSGCVPPFVARTRELAHHGCEDLAYELSLVGHKMNARPRQEPRSIDELPD